MTQTIYFIIVSSFFSMLLLMPEVIHLWHTFNMHQAIRTDGPQTHVQTKQRTPTMGGLLILFIILIHTLIWTPSSIQQLFLLATLLGFGAIGLIDDWKKIIYQKGIRSKTKYLAQSICAIGLWYGMYHFQWIDPYITLWPGYTWHCGHIWYAIWFYFTLVGSSNAVNLTDGLDGLVAGPVLAIATGLCSVAIAQQSFDLSLISATLIGSLIGFLWFNAYPARIIMGDVGALSLGALLAFIALQLHAEWVLIIVGFFCILETMSVILQVGSYRLRKKRIFRMAPIHHHFELMGLHEVTIVIRVWILSAVALMICWIIR